MGWKRSHYQRDNKRPRHASVVLCVVQCVDCSMQLQATHLVHRFGNRCRGCFDSYMAGAALMASHYAREAERESW
jgi:hypothetical protein